MPLHLTATFITSFPSAPKAARLINTLSPVSFNLPLLLLVRKEDPWNTVFSWQLDFLLFLAHTAIKLWWFLTGENLTCYIEGLAHKHLSRISLSKIALFFHKEVPSGNVIKKGSSYTHSEMQMRNPLGLYMVWVLSPLLSFSIITAASPKALAHQPIFSYTLMRCCSF